MWSRQTTPTIAESWRRWLCDHRLPGTAARVVIASSRAVRPAPYLYISAHDEGLVSDGRPAPRPRAGNHRPGTSAPGRQPELRVPPGRGDGGADQDRPQPRE